MFKLIKKNYSLFIVLGFSTTFFTGCSSLQGIEKNQLMVDYMEIEEATDNNEKIDMTMEEALKLAKNQLKDMLDIEFNEDDFELELEYVTPEMIENKLSYMDMGNYLSIELDYENELEQGYYAFTARRKDHFDRFDDPKEYNSCIKVEIDANTKKVISMNSYIVSFNISEYQKRSNEDNKKIVEKLVKEINEKEGTNYVIEEEYIRNFNSVVTEYYYLYKGEDNDTQKMLVSISTLNKNVSSISFGLKAFLEFYEIKKEL